MAPHSSTLAWKIPWTAEPGGLQSMGLLRVRYDWATSLSFFTFTHWRRKWQPTPVFLPGESQDWEAWWAAVYGVAQSRTWLKRLSSSSSIWYNKYLHRNKNNFEDIIIALRTFDCIIIMDFIVSPYACKCRHADIHTKSDTHASPQLSIVLRYL